MRYFMGYMTRHESIQMIIYDIVSHLRTVHVPSLVMGILALAFLLTMKASGAAGQCSPAWRGVAWRGVAWHGISCSLTAPMHGPIRCFLTAPLGLVQANIAHVA